MCSYPAEQRKCSISPGQGQTVGEKDRRRRQEVKFVKCCTFARWQERGGTKCQKHLISIWDTGFFRINCMCYMSVFVFLPSKWSKAYDITHRWSMFTQHLHTNLIRLAHVYRPRLTNLIKANSFPVFILHWFKQWILGQHSVHLNNNFAHLNMQN